MANKYGKYNSSAFVKRINEMKKWNFELSECTKFKIDLLHKRASLKNLRPFYFWECTELSTYLILSLPINSENACELTCIGVLCAESFVKPTISEK